MEHIVKRRTFREAFDDVLQLSYDEVMQESIDPFVQEAFETFAEMDAVASSNTFHTIMQSGLPYDAEQHRGFIIHERSDVLETVVSGNSDSAERDAPKMYTVSFSGTDMEISQCLLAA